jgi:tetratricopeptide (TPR) repeat protein
VHEPLPDEAVQRGLVHVDHSGGPEKRFILEANGAGVALLDLGGDGDLDVVLAQGLPSFGALLTGPGADLALFENDGTGRFRALPGPGLSGWWSGFAAGDIDGDGDTDLVAAGFGALVVLLQDEAGVLVPTHELCPEARRLGPGAARVAGAQPPYWATSLALADLDGDGVLDLYVGRYLDLDPVDPPEGALGSGALAVPCVWRGAPVFCGPRGLVAQPDAVYFGGGDGAFTDVTATHLVGHVAAYTLGVLATDVDGDGDMDVCVANDSAPNLLLVNDGTGRLTDFGYAAGFALGPDGQKEAGMGLAAGDVDGDGRVDLAVTNFSDEPTRLLLAAEVGFDDATQRSRLGRESRPLLSWGVHLVDLDGDGGLELFTANGHVHPAADLPAMGTSYGQRDTLWRFEAGLRAVPVPPATSRSLLFPASGSRGSAVGDLDGDGRPDLVVSRIDGPVALGMNRFDGAQWLEVRLAGLGRAASPRDGNGAVVELLTGERVQRRHVGTSGSYQSSSTPFVHIGLGEVERYTSLRVRWPSGRVDDLGPGVGGRRIFVREGAGLVRTEWFAAPVEVAAGEHAGAVPGSVPAAPTDEAAEPRAGQSPTGAEHVGGVEHVRAPLDAAARAELLDAWSADLAALDVVRIVREGPALVGDGGALAGDAEALGLVARALHTAGERERAYALLRAPLAAPTSGDVAAARAPIELALAEAALALADDDLERARTLVAKLEPTGPPSGPQGSPTERLRVLFPEEPLAWLIAGRALDRPPYTQLSDECLERFVALAPLHPEAPSALHLLARHALARRDGARAEALRAEADRRARWHEVFRARSNAKRAHPEASEPRLALAELWRAVGQLARARAELDALLALHPDHAEARTRRAALGD